MKKILLFGTFDQNYSRNRVISKALKSAGFELLECRVNPGLKNIPLLLWRFWGYRNKFDLMFVMFSGQEVMMLVKFLTRKPIIFDAFTSHYGGYILDRGSYPINGLGAKICKFLDKKSCQNADLVLSDTNAHINFFVSQFNLPREKFARLFVGSDSEIFYPRDKTNQDNNFLVHFHGNYIPLQGIEYIIGAAKNLENDGVTFNLIGGGQTYKSILQLAQEMAVKNVNFIDHVAYNKLPDYMAAADICLGIFGTSPKTNLVIPNKIYEALACAKPVITAKTDATLELLTDNETAILCNRADSKSLSDSIMKLKNDEALRNKIARNGYDLFQNNLLEKFIGGSLADLIYERRLLSK